MSEYQFKMFVDKNGEIDWYRRQPCSSTTLTQPLGRDDIVVHVDNVESLFGGDLGDVVPRQYTKRYVISDVTLSTIGNGVSSLIVVPEYWADNPITVEIDSVPTTAFTFTGNRVVFDTPPASGAGVALSVVIQGITLLPLAAEPQVRVNGDLLGTPDDYTVTQTGSGTRVVFSAALTQGDRFAATVEYYRSGLNVAWIGNERIEFYGVDLENNRLLQVQRGTRVTAARDHDVGTRVWDGSTRQSLRRVARLGTQGFTESDLLMPEWNESIVAFLSQGCD